MQVNWRIVVSVCGFCSALAGCILFRDRIYEHQLPGTDWTLVAYRIPTGLFDRRFELRLESRRKTILLDSSGSGDWFRMACAAAVVSPDRRTISYLIAIAPPELYLGAYDLVNEKKLGEEHIDREALRQEIARLYRGLPGFPKDSRVDLIKWATDFNSCQEAFQLRFQHLSR